MFREQLSDKILAYHINSGDVGGCIIAFGLICLQAQIDKEMGIFVKEMVAGVHDGQTWLAGGQRGEECKTNLSLICLSLFSLF